MGKKASQHLEMIMAFIIFSSFAFFLLYFLPLPKNSSITQSSLVYLENSFNNLTQEEITTISLKTNKSNSCFSVNLSRINISQNYKSKVTTTRGSVDSFINPGNILTINSEENFFIILLSEDIDSSSSISCQLLEEANYTFGGIKKEKYLTKKKISDFVNEYQTNYDSLKQNMGIPQNLDFTILAEPNQDLLIEDLSLDSPQVFSKTRDYKLINYSGDIQNIKINFKVWS